MSQRQLWEQIVELLSLSQYRRTMGGCMLFTSKAQVAMRVSKSKRVHKLAKQILETGA